MIKQLTLNRNPTFWLIFHILLGVVSTITPWVFILWYYFVLISSIPDAFSKTRVNYTLSFLLVYLVSFEVFARMVQASPWISYEQSKYITFLLASFGILNGYNKGKLGFLLVILLLPGLLYDLSGQVTFPYIIFDVLGPINIGLCVVFFYNQRFTARGFISIIRLMVYPIISALLFTFIKTPDFDSIEFELGANFETTGGFGSNQVSILFGLGVFLMFLFIVFKWRFSNNFWVDSFFLLGFAFQGLMSFSRGGVIGGILTIFIVIYMLKKSKVSGRKVFTNIPKIGKYLVPAVFILMFSFYIVNSISGGLLMLRYSGETVGTLAGAKDKSFDTFTSSRTLIAKEDLELFLEYPLLGTGGASSRYMRVQTEGTSPHIEFSRLLAEHGILGIFYIIVVAILAVKAYKQNQNPVIKSILFGFSMLAIYTTFHAASRTYISPLLFGLAMIYIEFQRKKKTEISRTTSLDQPSFPIKAEHESRV